jgi:hypothetical protein
MYAIKEDTLTALGDAVRGKVGVKYVIVDEPTNVEPFYSITIDTSTVQWDSNLRYKIDMYEILETALGDKRDLTKYYYCSIEYETNNEQAYYIVFGDSGGTSSIIFKNYEGFLNTDGFLYRNYFYLTTLARQSDLDSGATLTYTIKIWACDINKKFIALNKYTPLEMVDKVNGLDTLPTEALTITGDCQYRFAQNGWNWLINRFGDKTTTKNITNVNQMFYYSNLLEEISFDINIAKNATNFTNMFYFNSSLKSVPYIIGPERTQPTGNYSGCLTLGNMFQYCYNIRNIPYDYFWKIVPNKDFWDKNAALTTQSYTYIFQSCYSLREHPDISMLGGVWTSAYSCVYYNLFNCCYSLDKIENLPVLNNVNITSNYFNSTFSNCTRIKDLTFETNEDGTPKTANWKSQTIDLTVGVGASLTSIKNYILNYNSGITANKEVKDDATYQALKNDPDWFSTNFNYSRYNHDSAVNTINSLPDTSAYGTNTIKFKDMAGTLTDGGAINTLTEEEIAVAAAKGWTVTLV